MRIRHKVPAIFSLSMVDMLCCALGCVIMIWLLNAKQSEDEALERQLETESILASAKADREASQRLLAEAQGLYDQEKARVRALLGDRDKAAALIAQLEGRIRELEQNESALKNRLASEQMQAKTLASSLMDAKGQISSLQVKLNAEQKKSDGQLADIRKLKTDLASMQTRYNSEKDRAEALNRTIATKQKELAALGMSLEGAKQERLKAEKMLASRDRDLVAATAREKELLKQLDERRLALEMSDKKLTKLEKDSKLALDDALKKILALTKQNADAKEEAVRLDKEKQAIVAALNRRLAQLEKDKQSALDAADRKLTQAEKEKALLRLAVENRFAGITLTGKRVIFLIDGSGSMGWLDEKTKAPQKWVEVAATVAKLMRSLSDLEKFQVIVFNSGVSFPLGSVGRWIDYDAKTSADQAQRALGTMTPDGGTNMYAALDTAFRYRAVGLDTVYFLSDGLPNEGEGVEEAKWKGLQGVQRSAFLGKKVRTILQSNWNRPVAKQPRVKVNTIGFFYESPDLGAFLWALARENEGSFVGMSSP